VAIHYERDDPRRRIVIMSTGKVTSDEVLASLDRQAKEGAWSYSVLYDARAGRSVPTIDEVRRLVLHVGELTCRYGPRGPVALVTTNPQLSRIGHAYANLGELTALDVRVFTDVEDAEQWLDEARQTSG
jgi:hypothetical protein